MKHREAAAAWLLQAYVHWLLDEREPAESAVSLAIIAAWAAQSGWRAAA